MHRPLMASLMAALTLAACAKNPVTGERMFTLMSENQEISMGMEAKQQIADSIGLYPDPKVQDYVSSVGMKLAKTSERPNIPWSFQVVDDASINAFALPGGPIFITRGILTHMNSEAELASVLGHEIGHVTARHSVEQISKAQAMQLGLGIGMIAVPELQKFGQLAGAGLQVLMLKYGRDAEKQADDLGFKYSLAHKYDVREMTEMFQTLERLSAGSGGGKLPEWLSTHPDPGNRVAANQQRVQALEVDLSGYEVNQDRHMSLVDGMVYGENPRHGFFRGSLFLHPDMKFQLNFPGGWKTQNQPTVVGAMSPAQDAVVALAGAGKEAPEATLQKFLSQQGIAVGTTSMQPINGIPAAAATFQAQTEQGVIEGMTAFLSYGGQTFQLLGYTKQGGLNAYAGAFQSTFGSFAPLTDPSALAVQPAKLELVTVPTDMTVEQFHAQFPSTVPAKEIALINGLADGGGFKAGQKAKRVLGGVPKQQ